MVHMIYKKDSAGVETLVGVVNHHKHQEALERVANLNQQNTGAKFEMVDIPLDVNVLNFQ